MSQAERAMMIEEWHAVSDHAADGTPFGGFLCNCERVVDRAIELNWTRESSEKVAKTRPSVDG